MPRAIASVKDAPTRSHFDSRGPTNILECGGDGSNAEYKLAATVQEVVRGCAFGACDFCGKAAACCRTLKWFVAVIAT
jgi:hypothetical protein